MLGVLFSYTLLILVLLHYECEDSIGFGISILSAYAVSFHRPHDNNRDVTRPSRYPSFENHKYTPVRRKITRKSRHVNSVRKANTPKLKRSSKRSKYYKTFFQKPSSPHIEALETEIDLKRILAITIPSSKERRQHLTEQFQQHPTLPDRPTVWIPGMLYLNEISERGWTLQDKKHQLENTTILSKSVRQRTDRVRKEKKLITPGEVGTFMAHKRAWRFISEQSPNDGLGDWTLVLEDDAVLFQDIDYTQLPRIPKQADIVFLFVYSNQDMRDIHRFHDTCPIYKTGDYSMYGAVGYYIHRRIVDKLIHLTKILPPEPVDVYLQKSVHKKHLVNGGVKQSLLGHRHGYSDIFTVDYGTPTINPYAPY